VNTYKKKAAGCIQIELRPWC